MSIHITPSLCHHAPCVHHVKYFHHWLQWSKTNLKQMTCKLADASFISTWVIQVNCPSQYPDIVTSRIIFQLSGDGLLTRVSLFVWQVTAHISHIKAHLWPTSTLQRLDAAAGCKGRLLVLVDPLGSTSFTYGQCQTMEQNLPPMAWMTGNIWRKWWWHQPLVPFGLGSTAAYHS